MIRGVMVRVRAARAARFCSAAALSGAVMLSATGCSPELRPLVAVYADERGTAHALLRSCDGDGRVRGPWLRGTAAPVTKDAATSGEERDPGPAASGVEQPWIGWEAPGLNRAADFPLFAPPSAWAAEPRGPQTLRPDHSYELTFADPDDSYVYNASVTFDAGRLAELTAGEVLTLRGTMTREAFEELAEESC
ncbi:hypothetical protein [Streptomyces sp. NPDC058326]|uniref:hypothetical protein n=1 Tax=Streptomyces sp. NPDC058326 TaxID=3346447 RepID=UPI0036EE3E95